MAGIMDELISASLMNSLPPTNIKAKFILVAILVAIFFGIDIVANFLYIYWTYSWFDALMHFFGGTLVGSFFILLLRSVSSKFPDKNMVLLSALVSAIVIGICWEIGEYGFGVTHWSSYIVQDTISDLSMDIIGGLTAYLGWVCFNRDTIKKHRQ